MIELLGSTDAIDAEGNVVPRGDIPEFADPDILEPESPYDNVDVLALERQTTHQTALDTLAKIKKSRGPAVELGVRARELLTVLEANTKANQHLGLLSSPKIKNYNPDAIAESELRERHAAREAFKVAFGYENLLASGVPEEEVKAAFSEDYDEFQKTYLTPGSVQALKRRKKFRVELKTEPIRHAKRA